MSQGGHWHVKLRQGRLGELRRCVARHGRHG
nr:MAG TPA: hypothetical protein [Caudoviricetes sp.]DAP20998.1 MAG TPA: hypothetical protein [Caudoviricetes sp.]DAX42740.1 MAG TPA: hypothetical protein [Caudoviricetes sp.]